MEELVLAATIIGSAVVVAWLFLGVIAVLLLVFDTQPEPKKEVAE